MRPRSNTRIWSAWRTVESRWAMTKLVRPSSKWASASWIRRSVVLSTLAVASSRTRIGGFFSRARAMESLCFSPTLSLTPRSPSCVWSPLGRRRMKASAFAAANAVHISSSVASGFAISRLSDVVPLKRKLSCVTMATERRSSLRGISRIGRPSSKISPELSS